MYYSWAAAALFAAVAAFTDFKWRKIPNWLVLAVLATGFGYHGFTHTLPLAWQGFLFGAATIVLYLCGLWGAGDMKLMAALGSLVGPAGAFVVLFFTFGFFTLYALWFLIFRGKVKENLKREWRVLQLYGATLFNLMMGLRFGRVRELTEEIRSCQAGFVQVPFAVFLWLGVLFSWVLVARGW